jgi:hypothetical protein
LGLFPLCWPAALTTREPSSSSNFGNLSLYWSTNTCTPDRRAFIGDVVSTSGSVTVNSRYSSGPFHRACTEPLAVQSSSCVVRAGFMQIAISEGAALLHAASAFPSTSSGVGVKTAFSVVDCACAADGHRLATHRPATIATENGRGFMSLRNEGGTGLAGCERCRYRIFEYAADR